MKVNLVKALTSIIAIPSLTYLPFKYLNLSGEKVPVDLAKIEKKYYSKIDLRIKDVDKWAEWKKIILVDDNEDESVILEAVLSFISSYLIYRFITSITRTIMIVTLSCLLILKSLLGSHNLRDQRVSELIPDGARHMIEEVTAIIISFWDAHKDYVGQYIENLLYYACSTSKYIVISSLLGIIAGIIWAG